MADPRFRTLGERLAPHRERLVEAAEAERARAAAQTAAPAPRRRMGPGELMHLAFDRLDPRDPDAPLDIDWDTIEIVEASDEPDGPLEAAPDAAPAASHQGTVAPPTPALETTLPAAPPLAADTWIGRSWRDVGVDDEPASPHDPLAVRRLARDRAVPSLRLRGLDRHQAASRLRDFVVLARHADLRVVRLIPGKGIGSVAEPVLRPLVARWLDAHRGEAVLGWHYERDAAGEWGSVLVALRRLPGPPGPRPR